MGGVGPPPGCSAPRLQCSPAVPICCDAAAPVFASSLQLLRSKACGWDGVAVQRALHGERAVTRVAAAAAPRSVPRCSPACPAGSPLHPPGTPGCTHRTGAGPAAASRDYREACQGVTGQRQLAAATRERAQRPHPDRCARPAVQALAGWLAGAGRPRRSGMSAAAASCHRGWPPAVAAAPRIPSPLLYSLCACAFFTSTVFLRCVLYPTCFEPRPKSLPAGAGARRPHTCSNAM